MTNCKSQQQHSGPIACPLPASVPNPALPQVAYSYADEQDGEAQPPHLGGITSFGLLRSLIAALSGLSWQSWHGDRDAVHDLVGPSINKSE